MSLERKLTPVILPPGRFRLSTRPILIGSPPIVKTIGIVVVVALAATAALLAIVAMTATLRRTISAASAGSRSACPLGRSVLNHYVLAFDIADLAEPLAELGQPTHVGFEWRGVEKRDHRYS